MQRLHADDVSGTILKLQLPYVHLCLPMEFEPKSAVRHQDRLRRSAEHDGDLLDPVRFPRDAVEALKHVKGSYAYAGQYQQRPTPREGGLFKRQWFVGKIKRQAPKARAGSAIGTLPRPRA
jgi:hypothetical protein